MHSLHRPTHETHLYNLIAWLSNLIGMNTRHTKPALVMVYFILTLCRCMCAVVRVKISKRQLDEHMHFSIIRTALYGSTHAPRVDSNEAGDNNKSNVLLLFGIFYHVFNAFSKCLILKIGHYRHRAIAMRTVLTLSL